MRLYELTEQYNQVMDMLNNTDADMQAIKDTLEGLQGDIEDKAINIAKMIKTLDADIETIKVEEKRLNDRRKVYENRKDSIKEYLEQQLKTVGIEKVKTATMTVSMQNNPPSVNIVDEEALKEWAKGKDFCWIVKEPELSKRALLDGMKSGIEIPGAEIKQTKSLRIR